MIIRPTCIGLFVACFGMWPIAVHAASKLPYQEAGLTERQAVAYLMGRFAYGPRPGEIDRIVKKGIEQWLQEQLSGNLPDPELKKRLARFPALSLSARKTVDTYIPDGRLLNRMKKAGLIDVAKADQNEIKEKLQVYREENGLPPHGQLILYELPGQKLFHALYSDDQLVEVLTDFWFNHFNVDWRGPAARSILAYERDAIRPYVLGSFRDLLGAVTKHPAMLSYLGNDKSRAQAPNNGEQRQNQVQATQSGGGINENHARELMELHTLGVGGGYTQKDVIEVARALTGWSIIPWEDGEKSTRKEMERHPMAFIKNGDFLFMRDWHDKADKTILEEQFPAGGGIEEGERLLDMLSKHSSTARFISTKLSRRFIADHPPETVVNRLAKTFQHTNGDLRAVMHALAESSEFWEAAKQRNKMKSPFELAVSALRALKVNVHDHRQVTAWIDRMGQRLYRYPFPTGYPDYAEAWINSGTLIARMNFGLRLAMGHVGGIEIELPESGEDKSASTDQLIHTYAALFLPGQNTNELVRELKPMIPEQPNGKDAQIIALIIGSPAFQYH